MVLSRDIHDTKSNTLNFGQSLLFKVNAECQDQKKRFLKISSEKNRIFVTTLLNLLIKLVNLNIDCCHVVNPRN